MHDFVGERNLIYYSTDTIHFKHQFPQQKIKNSCFEIFLLGFGNENFKCVKSKDYVLCTF